jgi:hypothetical protein
LHLPAFFHRQVAYVALNGMYIYGFINMVTVAPFFAGFYAYPTHNGRKWIVFQNLLKSVEIIAALGIGQPCLNIFAGRAGTVAGRHKIHVHGAASAPVAGTFRMLRKVYWPGDVVGCGSHWLRYKLYETE